MNRENKIIIICVVALLSIIFVVSFNGDNIKVNKIQNEVKENRDKVDEWLNKTNRVKELEEDNRELEKKIEELKNGLDETKIDENFIINLRTNDLADSVWTKLFRADTSRR